jgi:hypothetical protein
LLLVPREKDKGDIEKGKGEIVLFEKHDLPRVFSTSRQP